MAATAAMSGSHTASRGHAHAPVKNAEDTEETEKITPVTIFYHLFEDPVWFEKVGMPGLQKVAFLISWIINILIFVSTVTLCIETMQRYSADCSRNPPKVMNFDQVTDTYVESTPGGDWTCTDYESLFQTLEVVCVACFTADFVIRLGGAAAAGTEYLVDFCTDLMNGVDLVAILPFYLKMSDFFANTEVLTVCRVARVLRLVRVLRSMPGAKHGNLASLITDIISNSSSALFVPLYFMGLAVVVFSSIMYYSELPVTVNCVLPEDYIPGPNAVLTKRGEKEMYIVENWVPAVNLPAFPNPPAFAGYDAHAGCIGIARPGATDADDLYGCQCPGTLEYIFSDGQTFSSQVFTSIPNCMWWCIVTFTTVGYGDISPQTVYGKLVGTLTMIAGVFFMAMPLAIVGDAFIKSWNELVAKKKVYKENEVLAQYDSKFTPGTWVPMPEDIEDTDTVVRSSMSRIVKILSVLEDERRDDDRRHELEELAHGQLQQKAIEAGADASAAQEALDSEAPSEALIDLIRAHEEDDVTANNPWGELVAQVGELSTAWTTIDKSLRDLDAKD